MARIYAGHDDITRGWGRLTSRCDLLEVTPEILPKTTRTLNRWRVESPRLFAFVLHLDPLATSALTMASAAGRSTLGEDFEKGWDLTMDRAKALAAKAILMPTTFSFSPSEPSRALIAAVAEKARKVKETVIWEATGSWDLETTRDWAESLGLAYAYDPFLAARDGLEFTRKDACFIVTERAGGRRRFDEFDMEDLLRNCSTYDRSYILLRGRHKWHHAHQLHQARRNWDL